MKVMKIIGVVVFVIGAYILSFVAMFEITKQLINAVQTYYK